MPALTLHPPAKTNLWLRVTGKREDGYHGIDTRMVSLSLADTLHLSPTSDGKISLTCDDPTLPINDDNLVLKAIRALETRLNRRFGARVELEKRIPHGAGLGGGSSDAASVLLGFNQLFDLGLDRSLLSDIAATIGSDVPYFIEEKVCDCTGRGEIVTPVEFPWELPVFLMKPAFSVPTGPAYARWSDSREIPGVPHAPQVCPWGIMRNDLERPVFQKYLMLARMKEWLLNQGEVHAAILSGSGSALLAVLTRNDRGRILEERALKIFGPTTWTWVGHTRRS